MPKANPTVEQAESAPEVMSSRDLAKSNGETQKRLLNDAQLAEIESWDDIARLMTENEIGSIDISDFGTGFEVLDKQDKARLVGVEFAILDWRFNEGDFGEPFVSLMVLVRETNRKFVVNDGGTGIRQQMQMVQAKLDKLGESKKFIRCPKGLTRSDYQYVDDKGEKRPATTFYLSLEK